MIHFGSFVKKEKISKLIPMVLVLFFFVSCTSGSSSENVENEEASNFKTDVEQLELRGRIKVLRQDEFLPGDSEGIIGNRTGENSFSFSFNEKGEKTKEVFYDDDGVVKVISEYTFSEDGKKGDKRMIDVNEDPISTCTYDYDEFGRIVRYNITDYKEDVEYYSETTYDDDGNEILDVTYSPDGQKIKSSEFTYVNGRKTRHLLMDHMDTPFAICEYEYNDIGDAVREIYYTGNNLIFEEYSNEYKYDGKGNWIMKIHRLEKKHMNTTGNENRSLGIQSVTMRTLTYY